MYTIEMAPGSRPFIHQARTESMEETRIYEPESFVIEIECGQIAVRTKLHICAMLSDVHISSVGY